MRNTHDLDEKIEKYVRQISHDISNIINSVRDDWSNGIYSEKDLYKDLFYYFNTGRCDYEDVYMENNNLSFYDLVKSLIEEEVRNGKYDVLDLVELQGFERARKIINEQQNN